MSYDRYLNNLWEEQCQQAEEATEAYDCQYDYIVDCIKKNKDISYSKGRTASADNCDFYDKVAGNQVEIMQLIANGNKDDLWTIMQHLFDKEIDSLVDLTIGISKYD